MGKEVLSAGVVARVTANGLVCVPAAPAADASSKEGFEVRLQGVRRLALPLTGVDWSQFEISESPNAVRRRPIWIRPVFLDASEFLVAVLPLLDTVLRDPLANLQNPPAPVHSDVSALHDLGTSNLCPAYHEVGIKWV